MKNAFGGFLLLGLACGGGGGEDSGPSAPPTSSEGRLVAGFGEGGVVSSDPGEFEDEVVDLKVEVDALYIVGTRRTAVSDSGWRIEKRDRSTGALLAEASSNPSAANDTPNAMALDATSVYVVGGDRDTGDGTSQWRIEKRRRSDLGLVADFGVNGVVQRSSGEAHGVAVDAQGLYVVGHWLFLGNDGWRIERCGVQTGVAEMGLGSNYTDFIDRAKAVAIDTTWMYVAGSEGAEGGLPHLGPGMSYYGLKASIATETAEELVRCARMR